MAAAFTNLSQWLWGGKHQERKISNASSSNFLAEACLFELDTVRFPLVNGGNMVSFSRRIECKIDEEHDVVVVPSDGECVGGSESDLDWSIGWLEPHGPGFQSNDELDSSFAVLVPCYGRGHRDVVDDPTNNILSVIGGMPDNFSPGGKKYMEQWLPSLQPASQNES